MTTLPDRILHALFTALLLSGCVVPGYPYYGVPPQGAIPPGAVPPQATAYYYGAPAVLPYAYAPTQIVVAPTFYSGWGYGYWYGNRFWPYRYNCGFWNGRYYNGYRWNGYRNWNSANHWQANRGNWNGANHWQGTPYR
jgi:hypothetical protein